MPEMAGGRRDFDRFDATAILLVLEHTLGTGAQAISDTLPPDKGADRRRRGGFYSAKEYASRRY